MIDLFYDKDAITDLLSPKYRVHVAEEYPQMFHAVSVGDDDGDFLRIIAVRRIPLASRLNDAVSLCDLFPRRHSCRDGQPPL